MTLTITLNGVLIFLASTAGIVLLIYLALTAIKLNRVLKDIRYILDKNKINIDSVMVSLPQITTNIEEITGELNQGVKAIASTAETIERGMGKASRSMEDKAESLVEYVQVVSEIVRGVIGFFKKRK